MEHRLQPVLRIPYGRRAKHDPIVLSAGEMLAILAALGSLRDRVLVTVLYSAAQEARFSYEARR